MSLTRKILTTWASSQLNGPTEERPDLLCSECGRDQMVCALANDDCPVATQAAAEAADAAAWQISAAQLEELRADFAEPRANPDDLPF